MSVMKLSGLSSIAQLYYVSTICEVTFSNVLGRLVQREQKGWDRGRWVGTQKGENSMAVYGLGCAHYEWVSHFSYVC